MVVGRPFNISITRRKFLLTRAIWELYSPEFQARLTTVKNPYGSGRTSKAIVGVLKEISLDGILKKEFYNMKQV